MQYIYVLESKGRAFFIEGMYTDFNLAVQAAQNWIAKRHPQFVEDLHLVIVEAPFGNAAYLYDKPDGKLIMEVSSWLADYMFDDTDDETGDEN